MSQLPVLLKSSAIVRFQHCDPYGHLFNAKYIDYFMNAREDQLITHYDLDVYEVGKREGLGWVVAQNQIAYLRPVHLMEKIWMTSQLIDYSNRSLTVECEMWDEHEKKLKSLMWVRFVHVDLRTGLPVVHAEKYMNLFQEVHQELDTTDFETRVKERKEAHA